jgi:hypothetical protein
MQIFADRIEFCWIHLRGIGALENSLWGYDGQGIRVWLNALAIEAPASTPSETSPSVKESVNIPLDFYPLCEYKWMQTNVALTFTPLKAVLMDKGIIIGAEHEAATRKNLPFVMFRHATSVSSIATFILLLMWMSCLFQVSLVFAPYFALPSRSAAGSGGCYVCWTLSTPCVFRTCVGDPSSYGRRVECQR